MQVFEPYKLKRIEDKTNPFSALFETSAGHRFYVEPAFYSQLLAIEEREPTQLAYIIEEMLRLVKNNRYVVFTLDFNRPITHVDNRYIFLEIHDVVGNLKLFYVNSSNLPNKAI